MIIVAQFSFKDGLNFIKNNHSVELKEVREIINAVDGTILKTKISKEKTMKDMALYSPIALNKAFNLENSRNEGGTLKRRIGLLLPLLYPRLDKNTLVSEKWMLLKTNKVLRFNLGNMPLWFIM